MPEGYAKFRCSWAKEPIDVPAAPLAALGRWRGELRSRDLLGATTDGVGFGNLSVRLGMRGFLITGSATGALERLEPRHYALVDETRPEENWLSCRGMTCASSESLTHAAVYGTLAWANGVIHVHSARMWQRYVNRLPTTPGEAEYGTPEMARAIASLAGLASLASGSASAAVLVMGGHRDGLIGFGADLDAAGAVLLKLYRAEAG